jgi:phage tail sheath gpL-like
MSSVQITVQTEKDVASLVKPSGQAKENIKRALNIINGVQSGVLKGVIHMSASTETPAAATGTITLVSAVATNNVVIGKTTFTFTSTPTSNTATAVDVEVDGANDTADAAALAAAINANALGAAKYVYATSAAGVVTLTSRFVGDIGNLINLSKTGAPITVSASYLAGGTGGAGPVANPVSLSRV